MFWYNTMKMNHSKLIWSLLHCLPNILKKRQTSYLPSPIPFIWCKTTLAHAQSMTKCLIQHVSLGFTTFDSPYFNVVKSYTLFCFLVCHSCKLTSKSPWFCTKQFCKHSFLKCHKFCTIAISFSMQPSWNIQCVGESLLKQLVPKFVSKNSRHL
jgi:hypothetical protein